MIDHVPCDDVFGEDAGAPGLDLEMVLAEVQGLRTQLKVIEEKLDILNWVLRQKIGK